MKIQTTNPIHNLAGLIQKLEKTYPQIEFQIGLKPGNRVFVSTSKVLDTETETSIQNILDTFDETLDSNKTAIQIQREQLHSTLITSLTNSQGKLISNLNVDEKDALLMLLIYKLGLVAIDGTLNSFVEWLSS